MPIRANRQRPRLSSFVMHMVQQLDAGGWEHPHPNLCPCRGGWLNSDWDTWHKCREHYRGQPNPEYDGEEAEEVFDYARARLENYRDAWRVARAGSGLDGPVFLALVRRDVGFDAPTPKEWVDAAFEVASREAGGSP